LVGRVAVVTAGDFELGDFEGLLFVNAHAPLRQLQHLGLADIDLQAVVEQLALDPLLVLAALGHLVGAAADQQGAAQAAPQGVGVSLEHDTLIWFQRRIRA
jgi:hypothetical protein